MNKIFFKVCRKFTTFFTKIKIKKGFTITSDNVEYSFTENERNWEYIINNLKYKDDSWNYIKYLRNYVDLAYQNKPVNFSDNEMNKIRYNTNNNKIYIDSKKKENNWICFFYNNIEYKNYMFEYDFIAESSLTEIQIAFNYSSLCDRYRFMIRNNSEVVFECINRGVFYERIFQKNYEILKNKKYRIRLVVLNNKFQYFINDELIFSIIDNTNLEKNNNLVLIFYNQHSNDDVKVSIENATLKEIK